MNVSTVTHVETMIHNTSLLGQHFHSVTQSDNTFESHDTLEHLPHAGYIRQLQEHHLACADEYLRGTPQYNIPEAHNKLLVYHSDTVPYCATPDGLNIASLILLHTMLNSFFIWNSDPSDDAPHEASTMLQPVVNLRHRLREDSVSSAALNGAASCIMLELRNSAAQKVYGEYYQDVKNTVFLGTDRLFGYTKDQLLDSFSRIFLLHSMSSAVEAVDRLDFDADVPYHWQHPVFIQHFLQVITERRNVLYALLMELLERGYMPDNQNVRAQQQAALHKIQPERTL